MPTPNLAENLDFIVHLWNEAGIHHWVVSPGSRNAPIVAALLRNASMRLHSAPDERSAAFVALGIAQSQQYPAGFLCTSGTALVNAFPAVCEAYYQRVPLVVVSADRPEYLIDQWDGQTLRQSGIFGTYTRKNAHINPRKISAAECLSCIYSTIENSIQPIPGPVHFNIELDEPIYEGIQEISEKDLPVEPLLVSIPNYVPTPFVYKEFYEFTAPTLQQLTEQLQAFSELPENPKIAIVVGQNVPSDSLTISLRALEQQLPVFCDVGSHQPNLGLKQWDWGLLKRAIPNDLKPDLLFTLGTTVLSKPLKNKLSEWKPKHIHLGLVSEIGDPFQTQPKHWQGYEADLLATLSLALAPESDWNSRNHQFLKSWETFIEQQPLNINDFQEPFQQELQWIRTFFDGLNSREYIIHMGNSMPIRYASWSGNCPAPVYANRGVSGIDGCISTAVGSAIANPDKRVFCIVGDVSSIYDSNAFWTDYPTNLTVIIINNHGGRIFDWIQGPNNFSALRPYIHTPTSVDFSHLAAFFNISYQRLNIQLPLESCKQAIQFSGGIMELK